MVVEGQHLHWQPWAPPVLLDPRSEAIRQALDGAPLADLIDALAEVEQRPTDHVRSELTRVVRDLDRHGLLEGSPAWRWWSPAALNRPLTACDAEAWNLDRADVFDLEVAGRRITVVVDDATVAEALRSWDGHQVLDAPTDLGTASVEVILATADRPGGVHRLFGRAGRTMARSTDRSEIIQAMVDHLAALEWLHAGSGPGAPGGHDEPVWFDATALVLPGDGVALVAGRARYAWARLARPLAAAGIVPVPGPAVAVEPHTRRIIPPPRPGPDLAELARRCGTVPTRQGPPTRTPDDTDLTVTRIDHIASTHELTTIRRHGHDPDRLDPAMAAHRLALLAHLGALDHHPHRPPDLSEADTILDAVARLATAPPVRSRIHDATAALVTSLRTSGAPT